MLHLVYWRTVTDISKDQNAFILRVRQSKTLVTVYQSTWRHFPEDLNLQQHHSLNRKIRRIKIVS